ncbi:MAG: chemotaxis protein CheW [Lachnospiraceae bacterium]|nr:chemotaxis protein CheW [Lachnospiraceae bacterium]MDE6698634.1 chemotaxis protein CheW [Lachnospiraceae bacterium]
MDNNKTEYNSVQYIVVNLGDEQYGIDIKYVDNIVRLQKITRVPKAQNFFNGVINLRGEIIPVMSVRKRFGLEADIFTDKTRIIVIKPEQQEAIGILVDVVKEVVTLKEDQIEKVYADGNDEKSKFITAVGKSHDNLISLMNINGVLDFQTL